MSIKNDSGLLVDDSTSPQTCVGYIFNFAGHGAYSPDGKVMIGGQEIDQAQVDAHNRLLADAQWQAMLKHGKGLLYLTGNIVSDFPERHKVETYRMRKSWHNIAGKDGRTDVWFQLDGSRWHGVNIGDNQILRVKRLKS